MQRRLLDILHYLECREQVRRRKAPARQRQALLRKSMHCMNEAPRRLQVERGTVARKWQCLWILMLALLWVAASAARVEALGERVDQTVVVAANTTTPISLLVPSAMFTSFPKHGNIGGTPPNMFY